MGGLVQHAQVPGPADMARGRPWPSTVPLFTKPVHTPRLESFETIAKLKKEGSFSPDSMTYPPSPAWDLASLKSQVAPRDQTLKTQTLNLEDSTGKQHTLCVPEVAQTSYGGWFDSSNWLFKMVHQEVCDMSNEELLQALYYRESRPEYGEDHTSTRTKKGCNAPSHGETEIFCPRGKKGTKAHRMLERFRRDRHRVLQCEVDGCTGTYMSTLVDKMLPSVKRKVKAMVETNWQKPLAKDRKIKTIGKDEQLTAAAMMPHLYNIIIFRELEARVAAEDYAMQLERELGAEHEARLHVAERLAHTEVQNKQLQDEINHLRHRIRLTNSPKHTPSSFYTQIQPQHCLPSPKRTAADCDQFPNECSQIENSEAKRRNLGLSRSTHRV